MQSLRDTKSNIRPAIYHAPLMEWGSHLYVVCGVTYVETYSTITDGHGGPIHVTHKFLLQDTRFFDSRREISFESRNRRRRQSTRAIVSSGRVAIAPGRL